MRVGGWLQRSLLSENEKHPLIVNGKGSLAKLIIRWAHSVELHDGFRLTYTLAIRKAWIVGGQARVKQYVRNCVTCAKVLDKTSTQCMDTQPTPRVVPSPPFSHCSVDHAGPFQILSAKGRGIRSTKGYITIFVCLSTKGIHLELVSDLSTYSFIGALIRFTGRRGKPSEIWSDNGASLRGANIKIHRLLCSTRWHHLALYDTLSTILR